MNAPTANSHIVYMPKTMAQPAAAVQAAAPTGLVGAVAAALRFVTEMPRRAAVKRELSRLSDRELADIGLTRSQIADVFSR